MSDPPSSNEPSSSGSANPPPTPGAANPESKSKQNTTARTIVRLSAGIASIGAVLILVWLGLSGRYTELYYWAFGSPSSASQTEAVFIRRVDSGGNSDLRREWLAAREDHKRIAFAIAECDGFTQLDSMPRQIFSLLLLDLAPSGQHQFPSAQSEGNNKDKNSENNNNTVTINLVGLQPAMLTVSDQIARARMEAARAANEALPGVTFIGWAAIAFTALTTFLVSLKPMIEAKNWATAITVSTLVVSVLSTALTSVKSVYDPTQAYSANEQALVKLRNLHRRIAMAVAMDHAPQGCVPASGSGRQDASTGSSVVAPNDYSEPVRVALAGWAKQLDDIESAIIPATVVVPNSALPQAAQQPVPQQASPAAAPTPGNQRVKS
jgi:hypothetical protein